MIFTIFTYSTVSLKFHFDLDMYRLDCKQEMLCNALNLKHSFFCQSNYELSKSVTITENAEHQITVYVVTLQYVDENYAAAYSCII